MYEELGSVKQPVELPPSEALASAEELLSRQGYRVIYRTDVMVVGKRENPSGLVGGVPVHLAVVARPHPEGGLAITLQGDDREGVRERQGEWRRWAEGLPKRRPREEKGRRRVTGTPGTNATAPPPRQAENEPRENAETGRPPARAEWRTGPKVREPFGQGSRAGHKGSSEEAKDKDPDTAPRSWTSVPPWERKLSTAPGKSDAAENGSTEAPTRWRGSS